MLEPDDFGLHLDPVRADEFLNDIMGGMGRAQERFRARLRTVDGDGNPIDQGDADGQDDPAEDAKGQ